MQLITQGKTNWRFLGIVIILAVIAGGGIWWQATNQKTPPSSEVAASDNIFFVSPQGGEQWKVGESHTIEIKKSIDEPYPFTHLTLNKPDGEEIGIIYCKIGGIGKTVFDWDINVVLKFCGASSEEKIKNIEPGAYMIAITKDLVGERPILAASEQFSIVVNETANWQTKITDWKTYEGGFSDIISFSYPGNLNLAEGDADYFSVIRLWDPLSDDRDNEFTFTMPNQPFAAQIIQTLQQEGFTKEKELYVDGFLAFQFKGMATPDNAIVQRMVAEVVVWVDDQVYGIANWRADENDEIFQKILTSIKFK